MWWREDTHLSAPKCLICLVSYRRMSAIWAIWYPLSRWALRPLEGGPYHTSMSHHNLYNTVAWRKLRQHQLTVEPLCRMCLGEGRTTAATVCDPITPHRGDPDLFWSGPFQSLCATCHSLFKQSEESGGLKHLRGCDEQGEPLFFEW